MYRLLRCCPGGGLPKKVLYGEAPPGGSTLTLYKYTNFYQNGTPLKYLEQNCTPFLYLKDKPKQYNYLESPFFSRFSVVLIQLRSHFCQNVAPFDILRFSHHFFHFAADFVTLSHTKMAIFPTLLNTASLKKVSPLSGGASRYSSLWRVPPPPDCYIDHLRS